MAVITGAVVGVATAAVSIGMSVSQANKAAAARSKAEKEAQKTIDEAKKEFDRMPMQELSLNLDAYKQAQESQNVAAATGIDAAQQGDGRNLAAAVGRVNMANVEGQRDIRLDQIAAMEKLDTIKAKERQTASDAKAELSLAEAEGAQAAAADASARQTAATTAAVQGAASLVQGVSNLSGAIQGPYDTTSVGMAAGEAMKKGDASIYSYLDQGDFSGYEGLSGDALRAYMENNLTVEQINSIDQLPITL